MKHIMALLGCCVLLVVGCEQANDVQSNDQSNHIQQVKDSQPTPVAEASNHEIAEHLAQLASRVPDVHQATAIIAGPYAMVAIDVEDTLDRARVGTVKYSVSEALYEDPYGKTAVVIADADIMERFRQMNKHIKNGSPVQGIVDELASIVGRYMPVTPNKEKQAPKDDQYKKSRSDEDDKELENIQEEQSDSDQYD